MQFGTPGHPLHIGRPLSLSRRPMGLCRALMSALLLSGLAGCASEINRHGHLFSETDLQQIQPGMSQEQVRLTLGTPDTTATVGGQAFYYISSTTKQVAFFKPEEVDRRIVAVYFNPLGSVERIGNYGMQDGKVFDFVTRETPTKAGERSLLGELFRGIGKKKIDGGDTPNGAPS